MTYSTEFRRKVLDIKEQENLTAEETAKRFGIGITNFSRWKKQLEPKRTRNKPATKIDRETLKRDVELYPDADHYERAIRFKVIVFIDESGFAHDMPRRKGYAPVGKRCFGTQDWHAKGRTNVIGALLGFCLLTVTLFSGSINSHVFLAWLTQDLIPKLPKNSVVVMDNARFHKRADIQQALFGRAYFGIFTTLLPRFEPNRA